MDTPLSSTPQLSDETLELCTQAERIYHEQFSSDAFFGRCIFLSWYCERGTCDFCFRSTQKHKIKHPETARRSIGSVVAEAALIRAFNWNLEFLTGGYGIYPFEEIVRIARICHQVIGKPLWINLGVLEREQLEALRPFTEGIVSSLETLNPTLHAKVCPDKPIEPYLEMMEVSRELGFKQSFTLVLGLGEDRLDFSYVKALIETYRFERITIYALRPVAGTPYQTGPTTEEMVWWISMIRITFPTIEIIAGTAAYRIPEISLLLRSGANGFTKLPATRLFNTKQAASLIEEATDANRKLVSIFSHSAPETLLDWKVLFSKTDLTVREQEEVLEKVNDYLMKMKKRFT